MIEHVDAVVALRRHETLERGALPEKAVAPVTELRQAGNPGGRPLQARTDFAAGLDLPLVSARESTDVLLWLGEGTYDLRYGRTLRALVRLLREAGVDFAVLGPEERDTGDLARRLGDEATFQDLARTNAATLARHRFRRIVTADPHALHALRNEYPAFGARYPVVHHTAFLLELVRAGRLNPGRLPDRAVTFHDQTLGRGARRRVRLRGPVLATIHPDAPAPLPFAYGQARRGVIETVAGDPAAAAAPVPVFEERPYRRRPKLVKGAPSGGSAARRRSG